MLEKLYKGSDFSVSSQNTKDGWITVIEFTDGAQCCKDQRGRWFHGSRIVVGADRSFLEACAAEKNGAAKPERVKDDVVLAGKFEEAAAGLPKFKLFWIDSNLEETSQEWTILRSGVSDEHWLVRSTPDGWINVKHFSAGKPGKEVCKVGKLSWDKPHIEFLRIVSTDRVEYAESDAYLVTPSHQLLSLLRAVRG